MRDGVLTMMRVKRKNRDNRIVSHAMISEDMWHAIAGVDNARMCRAMPHHAALAEVRDIE